MNWQITERVTLYKMELLSTWVIWDHELQIVLVWDLRLLNCTTVLLKPSITNRHSGLRLDRHFIQINLLNELYGPTYTQAQLFTYSCGTTHWPIFRAFGRRYEHTVTFRNRQCNTNCDLCLCHNTILKIQRWLCLWLWFIISPLYLTYDTLKVLAHIPT